MSETGRIQRELPLREKLQANREDSINLYVATGATVAVFALIILSQLYAFPGPQSSLVSFTFSNITYKIYPFQYCVSGGKDDEYGADGNGCHLNSNPLGYVLSTNKLPTPTQDIQLFHALTSTASFLYYIDVHLCLLLVYHFWRRVSQTPWVPLWSACLYQTLILIIPASILTFIAQKTAAHTPPHATVSLGHSYLFLLHSFWLVYLLACMSILVLSSSSSSRMRIGIASWRRKTADADAERGPSSSTFRVQGGRQAAGDASFGLGMERGCRPGAGMGAVERRHDDDDDDDDDKRDECKRGGGAP
ncbi:hypothetical protein DSL72_006433 [Monilinia vaccinii-corymbosi]|uniref:Uncharacterized protein n=1 Tax=Monilinia vaccinii-corymbosi TaxID=61207 RepID=A0A8A3PNG8_9HELO|nr:hypothetical protein DSL72_006433 [Monilinia vaccinii-corymbosi]